MKARSLAVRECMWTSEECHLVDEQHGDTERESLCLPNIFKSKKVKPLAKAHTSPTYQVYHTARELLLEALDREAVRELIRRSPGVTAGDRRPSHSQIREQSADLSEQEYTEALMWFSIVLQSGLSVGENCKPGHELKLDRWQGVLKRNSIQTKLLSLTGLEDEDKLQTLSGVCSHICRRYQSLHAAGPNLVVKKYRLSYQQSPCSLHLALLCDARSGFICNMYLYCKEQVQKQSRRPVVEQVVKHLLRPFCSQSPQVHVDSSAWMDGRLNNILSALGVDSHFVLAVKKETLGPRSFSSPPLTPQRHRSTSKDSKCKLLSHLQGWTGPALFPLSDLTGSAADVLMPGLWVVLHIICINTYVLHTLQSRGLGRHIQLTEFTRALASQLGADNSVIVPVMPRLNSWSYQDSGLTNLSKQRCAQVMESEKQSCSAGVKLQTRWHRPGVCGLDNSGNSCYLNAVLQCLCSTVPLVEHLLNRETCKELVKSKCRVSEAFVRLLEKMWLGGRSSCAPAEVRSMICSVLPQFNNNSQQDAQELLLYLLNVLHDDFKKVAKWHMRYSTQQQRQEQNRSSAIEFTIVSQLFEGQLSYMNICMHCHHQAHNKQAFTILSLPIPKDIMKCSIKDCLSLFFQQTILTGGEQILCSVCGLRSETAILTCLESPPEILVLHLKRFGCKGKNQVKLRTNVLFSMKLDLTPFLSSSEQNTYSPYHLYAVVNHAGHLNMGHYTALCYNGPAQMWHCFDDAVVREVQDGLVQSPNAYMLLYSHKPLQKPNIHGL
ncbi:uncharacterized protein LOC133459941 [Cololabis saira]|uniref:uncharacterized protein LOC133459941 n=1 Tax=Cololabis saira TaxID=129043 RepID=UPI002AD1F0E4|nr:uncharacterized protein LOC133459941 [Cololabis saira]